MVTTTNATAKPAHRATHELRRFAIVFVYLYIIIGAITVFKTAVLHTHGIDYAFWGISAIKAAVLAKFMLLGHAMKIGEGDTTSPLIWPTLHRALGFLVLLVILTIIEEIVVGLLRGRSGHKRLLLVPGVHEAKGQEQDNGPREAPRFQAGQGGD